MDDATYKSILAVTSSLQTLFIFATAITAIVAISRARKAARSQTAVVLWDKYLGLAIQYPKLACPIRFKSSFDYVAKTVDGDPLDYERYEWIFSVLVETGSEILHHLPRTHRVDLLRTNLKYHADYIKVMSTQQKGTYLRALNPKIIEIMDEIAKG